MLRKLICETSSKSGISPHNSQCINASKDNLPDRPNEKGEKLKGRLTCEGLNSYLRTTFTTEQKQHISGHIPRNGTTTILTCYLLSAELVDRLVDI